MINKQIDVDDVVFRPFSASVELSFANDGVAP